MFGQSLREAVESMTPTELDPRGIHPLTRVKSLVNPANMAQRLSPLPVAFDDATRAVSMDHFNPASRVDDGTVGIFNQLRFTEDTPTASSVAMTYHNMPDVGSKVLAFRNIALNQLFAMGSMRGYMASDLTKAPDVEAYLKDAFTCLLYTSDAADE